MSETPSPGDVDALLDRTLVGDDPTLTAALQDSAVAGLPSIAVSAQQGKFLNLLATAMGAKRVLEIGTLGGYSTIWLARAVGADGHVATLEYDSKNAEVARANLDRAEVGDRVEVVVGPALETLPTLAGEPFDLVFIDADKKNNAAYLKWAIDLTHPGSVILVDNVIRDGAILQPDTDNPDDQGGTRETLELMGQHPRLDAAAIQTTGAKGWDGFALAVVR
jgi:predicted O-methyltransferase YrrM